MRKPWSFQAIEFINYIHLGLSFVISSYLIWLLISDRLARGVFGASFPQWLALLLPGHTGQGGPSMI